jgi:hypothetical protein
MASRETLSAFLLFLRHGAAAKKSRPYLCVSAAVQKACHTMAMKVFIDNFAPCRSSFCLASLLEGRLQ